MRSVLVTGGAGFIGSHLAKYLLASGDQVTIVDDMSGGFHRNIPEGVDFRQISILDHKSLDSLFEKKRFDAVYHLAAYAAEGLSHFIRRKNYEINLVGSANVINACVNNEVGLLVFASSAAVYGWAYDGDSPAPIDPYGVAKLAVEFDLCAANRTHGLVYSALRFHNVYGPGQNLSDPYRNVVGIFLRKLIEQKPLTIFGGGSQRRPFTYIDDILPILAKPPCGGEFDIGARTTYSVLDLANMLRELWPGGQDAILELLPERHEAHIVNPPSVLLGGLETSLRDGLTTTAQWAQTVFPKAPQLRDDIEIQRNLPEVWRKQ